jgi:hypothetical protein
MSASRTALEREHERLIRLMEHNGLEPILDGTVRDVMSDNELALLIKHEGLRLMRFKRYEAEQ